ncbi:MAG: C4-type zinc ribbon domain-containing protein [Anaerolineales bacterium]|nr:C4-type zinc ribbon domain-containing protein [Anaerolineales bacterium]
MSLSKTLYQLQQFDTKIDQALKRIQEIDSILSNKKELEVAFKIQEKDRIFLDRKKQNLQSAEQHVEIQNTKLSQNQSRLYGGAITNPKELEDLQMESVSLQNYLSVLEERQLEAMLEADQAQDKFSKSSAVAEKLTSEKDSENKILSAEKSELEIKIVALQESRSSFLDNNEIPEISIYEKIRKSSGGIAVTLMINSSCTACGSNIPSAIEQEVRSPKKISFCPACKRILNPGVI